MVKRKNKENISIFFEKHCKIDNQEIIVYGINPLVDNYRSLRPYEIINEGGFFDISHSLLNSLPKEIYEFMKNYNEFNHNVPEDRYITGKILKNPMLVLCLIEENNKNIDQKTIGAIHSIEKKLNKLYFRINIFDKWQNNGYGSYLLRTLEQLYRDYYLCCKFSDKSLKARRFFEKNEYDIYKKNNMFLAIKKPKKPIDIWNYSNLHLRDLK